MQNDEKSRTSSQGPDGSSIENEAHEQTRMTTKSKECSFSPLLVSLLTTAPLVFIVYYLSQFPSTPGGDSGELLAEACLLGTPHPPGYPLWTIMSHLFMKIPLLRLYMPSYQAGESSHSVYNSSSHTLSSDFDQGSLLDVMVRAVNSLGIGPGLAIDRAPTMAWKVNCLCCLLGSLTATFIAASVSTICLSSSQSVTSLPKASQSISFHFSASTIAALLYAFGPLVWEYSVSAEVFALNNFLCSLLVYLTCLVFTAKTNEQGKVGGGLSFAAGALVSGFCLANQHSSALIIFILVPSVVIYKYPKSLSLTWITSAALCFLVGISPYVYLYIASSSPAPGSWGDMTDFKGLMKHILRSEYGTFQLGFREGSESFLERVYLYFLHASKETFYAAVPCSLIGLFCSLTYPKSMSKGKNQIRTNGASRESVHLMTALFLAWLFYTLIWHAVFSNLPLSAPMPYGVHARFWMQPNIFLCVFAGVGIAKIFDWMFLGLQARILGDSTVNEQKGIVNSKAIMSAKEKDNIRTKQKGKGGSDGKVMGKDATREGGKDLNREKDGIQVDTPTSSESKSIQSKEKSTVWNVSIEISLIAVVATFIVSQRFDLMNKSNAGWVIHRYGERILQSLPPNSLLVSHTDLDWNPVRYLQRCQGMRPDVTHLSFQLMPYPWFDRQMNRHYPHINFPPMNFSGVSTERSSKGNTMLVRNFLVANGAHTFTPDADALKGSKKKTKKQSSKKNGKSSITGGIYIDMQAINDVEIEAGGRWHGLTLVPWGSVYRIYGPLSTNETALLHHSSFSMLKKLQEKFPLVNDEFITRFPDGSWEFAAASVFYDAHYQQNAKVDSFPLLLDRLYVSSQILSKTLDAVLRYKTISSPPSDLHKNTALSFMRLQGALTVASQYNDVIKASAKDSAIESQLLAPDELNNLLTHEGIKKALTQAESVISEFTKAYPSDRDVEVFRKVARAIKSVLQL